MPLPVTSGDIPPPRESCLPSAIVCIRCFRLGRAGAGAWSAPPRTTRKTAARRQSGLGGGGGGGEGILLSGLKRI